MTTPMPEPTQLRDLATTTEEPAEARTLPGQRVRVVLDDGSEFVVRTTNRDHIAWDKTPPARRGRVEDFTKAPFVFAAFLAWSAARREEQLDRSVTFDAFLDLAEHIEPVAVEDADEVRPTR